MTIRLDSNLFFHIAAVQAKRGGGEAGKNVGDFLFLLIKEKRSSLMITKSYRFTSHMLHKYSKG
jgi:hypothetical protein